MYFRDFGKPSKQLSEALALVCKGILNRIIQIDASDMMLYGNSAFDFFYISQLVNIYVDITKAYDIDDSLKVYPLCTFCNKSTTIADGFSNMCSGCSMESAPVLCQLNYIRKCYPDRYHAFKARGKSKALAPMEFTEESEIRCPECDITLDRRIDFIEHKCEVKL